MPNPKVKSQKSKSINNQMRQGKTDRHNFVTIVSCNKGCNKNYFGLWVGLYMTLVV